MKYLIYILTLMTFSKIYAQSNIKVGEKAPKINITNWIENVPEDKDLQNKYIVLEFWATWCGPCIAAVPHMNKIQEEFNQNDLYYISITDESVEKVERSLKRIDFNSIVVTDLTKKTQIQFGDGIEGLDAYPLTVLINKNAIIKWIGEPKSLNSKIMSEFLSNVGTSESTIYKSEKSVNPFEKNEIISFKELLNNEEIKYYFSIQETNSNRKFMATRTGIMLHNGYKLSEIYYNIFNIKNYQLKLPKSIQNRTFNLVYKNSENPEDLSLLEDMVLKNLGLTKEINIKFVKVNTVSIQDKSLLEETLEKVQTSKSGGGDRMIFTKYTIKNMMDDLSVICSEPFIFNNEDEKDYDFIIDTKSKKDIIDSLNSYGIKVDEKNGEVEFVTLIEDK